MDVLSKVSPKKVSLSNYQMDKTLGTGSFGRVKLAKNKKSGKYVAIKILKKADIIKLKQVDHILNEVKILSMIEHPFLVTTLHLIIINYRLQRMVLRKIRNIYI